MAALGLATALALAARPATAQIYLCVDANGHKELTDTNKNNNCKALDVPGAISAPVRKPQAGPRAAAAAPPPPGDFPRVDGAEQRARDSDRRAILTDELNAELQKLADLRKEFNNGEPERRGDERNYAKYQERLAQLRVDISRSEKNVEALKREIANIR